MAYSAPALLLLLCSLCSVFSDAKHYLSIPIVKQPVTGRFVAKIFHGTDPHQLEANLVLDLGCPVTKLNCRRSLSSTRRLVSCPSLQCSKASGSEIRSELGDQLVEDLVAVRSVDSVNSSVDRFLFHCSGDGHGSNVLGLGRSKMSLPSQFSMTHFLDRKFTLCLSSSEDGGGRLLIGDALAGTQVSKTLTYTPLLTDSLSHSAQHIIPVKSIKIGSNDPDPIKVNGRARLSTTAPFTTLPTSIYQSFINKFVKSVITSSSNNNETVITQSVWAPFKTCFVTRSVFPEVDLVLQSEMVKWRIGKRNLMVVVDKVKGVSCLWILEDVSGDEIVIGRYQLEENMLEFDMARSMLGFRSSRCTKLTLLNSVSTRRSSS